MLPEISMIVASYPQKKTKAKREGPCPLPRNNIGFSLAVTGQALILLTWRGLQASESIHRLDLTGCQERRDEKIMQQLPTLLYHFCVALHRYFFPYFSG
jgi:hypothetical protein